MAVRDRQRKEQGVHQGNWCARQLCTLLIAVALIGGVASLQWARPDVAEALRQRCASLMLCQVDFEESFSALGEALQEGNLPEAVETWCASVFTPPPSQDQQETEEYVTGDGIQSQA